MDLQVNAPGKGHTPEALADAARVQEIWRTCRARHGAAGPYLFGSFGAADCFYAPVVFRFLGYGVPPPHPSWGAMLSATGRSYMVRAPWLSIFPGLALALAVFGFNVLGDALRDLLDPRLRGT